MLIHLPAELRQHPLFPELTQLVQELGDHQAMRVPDQMSLENVARLSLLATICFYAHLMGCARGELQRLTTPSLFHVALDTGRLEVFRQMLGEEITATNIPTEKGLHSPHFVPMYESAEAMCIELASVDLFLALIGRGWELEDAAQEAGFHPAIVKYFKVSELCSKTYAGCVATVALRENTLSSFFTTILENLPKESAYEKYRVFLSSHVMLDAEERADDEQNHGQLMLGIMAGMVEEDRELADPIMRTMVDFYRARKEAYDACLEGEPIF